MKRCPRCHSSMLPDHSGPGGEWERVWKCLGCGREILVDPVRRAEDHMLLRHINRSLTQPRS